ncbi:hypothetical protein AB0C76_33115 [Kitasatospora sp. NPDC048722]|uniref:hypothetical protein n=1 Tax=Kitasatospora sp. NPDC048722 TaxID=3155639 RepID=UPI0033FF898C
MIYDPLTGLHYCLDPWCDNPDPDRIDAPCGCGILPERELEQRKREYFEARGRTGDA